MKELLRKLCTLPGVSSWEDQVRDCVMEVAGQYATELRVDAMGNVIAFKEGAKATGNKLLLTAHMDEVGLMVRAITDEGYLKFDTVGHIDRRVLLGKRVLVGPRLLPAVVGLKAYHLVSRDEEKNVPKLDEFYLDIGAKSKEEAEKLVRLGDVAAFDSTPELFGNGLLKGRALDSRIGCAVLLWLMREELPMDCTFVFTAQQEVGARGAFGAAFSVQPEIALVLEGLPPPIWPGCPPTKGLRPGQGRGAPHHGQGRYRGPEALRDPAEAGGGAKHPLAAPGGHHRLRRRHGGPAGRFRRAYGGDRRPRALPPHPCHPGQRRGYRGHAPADPGIHQPSVQGGLTIWIF